MRASTDRTHRLLEMARQIAEGEKQYISDQYAGSPITKDDGDAIYEFAGEMVAFDDDGLMPTEQTTNERVVFLCFAAAALK